MVKQGMRLLDKSSLDKLERQIVQDYGLRQRSSSPLSNSTSLSHQKVSLKFTPIAVRKIKKSALNSVEAVRKRAPTGILKNLRTSASALKIEEYENFEPDKSMTLSLDKRSSSVKEDGI